MGIGLLFLIFFLLMLIGMPIAFSLGLASLFYVIANDMTLSLVPQRMTDSLSTFLFVALPLYILAGEIMNRGGITNRLINLAKVFVGFLRGGLAHVNVFVSMLFGGIQGMAAADTAAIGSVMIPAMRKDGYDPAFSAAITISSSVIGAVIPPSFLFILFGATAGVPVGNIFLAGILPGVLIVAAQMFYIFILSKRKKTSSQIPEGDSMTLKQGLKYLLEGLPSMIMPVIIIGGVMSGVMTVSESAVVAVVYAIVYSIIIRENNIKVLMKTFFESAQTAGSVMIILCTSTVLAYIMTVEGVPQMIVNLLTSITENKIILLFIIALFLLLLGTFMDPTPATLILAPILLPVMVQLGLDPVQVAVVVCFSLTIGLITPPVGSSLFIGAGISGLSIERISVAIFPLILINAAVLLMVIYIPFITMFLPTMFGG